MPERFLYVSSVLYYRCYTYGWKRNVNFSIHIACISVLHLYSVLHLCIIKIITLFLQEGNMWKLPIFLFEVSHFSFSFPAMVILSCLWSQLLPYKTLDMNWYSRLDVKGTFNCFYIKPC
uniref:Uncharacterized protein n=1 Tax=Cacopsylla melanoneura TaxID=428564 RepID=A0A8D9EJG5_9HEMI